VSPPTAARLVDSARLLSYGIDAFANADIRHQSEVSFSEVRWLKLDPVRGVTMGNWLQDPDLSKVDEVGFFDVIPGSGVRVGGVPVEKIPAPPVGGWIAMSAFELWGKAVSRNAKASE
jgi:hypothetical protein